MLDYMLWCIINVQVDSSLIDEYTLMAVQNLLHLYNSVMQHILFDFRLWNNSDKWEVRVG